LIFADFQIERCERCKRFPSDLEAALHYFNEFRDTTPYVLDKIQLDKIQLMLK
jgi:hypothetical protein